MRAESGSPLPPILETAYLCDLLGLSYTQLAQQPESWVKAMLFYYRLKNKVTADLQPKPASRQKWRA